MNGDTRGRRSQNSIDLVHFIITETASKFVEEPPVCINGVTRSAIADASQGGMHDSKPPVCHVKHVQFELQFPQLSIRALGEYVVINICELQSKRKKVKS